MTSFAPRDPDYAERVHASFDRQRVMAFIGARLVSLRAGYCEIHLPYREELSQQDGYFHAGIISTIADSAGGYAGYSLMSADSNVLTVEYKLNLISPANGKLLIARGHVLRAGKTLVATRADVVIAADGDEILCAAMQQTLICLPHGRQLSIAK